MASWFVWIQDLVVGTAEKFTDTYVITNIAYNK